MCDGLHFSCLIILAFFPHHKLPRISSKPEKHDCCNCYDGERLISSRNADKMPCSGGRKSHKVWNEQATRVVAWFCNLPVKLPVKLYHDMDNTVDVKQRSSLPLPNVNARSICWGLRIHKDGYRRSTLMKACIIKQTEISSERGCEGKSTLSSCNGRERMTESFSSEADDSWRYAHHKVSKNNVIPSCVYRPKPLHYHYEFLNTR
ncbi:uncharacterized protein BDR25DRAFT_390357 [Lindgomyces ingoldianus]|uniref:Uncharacterized protein n=1 Tax=Lindgomyces ingoldianus TaxID=673940 RepID=A0ACB6RG03_9PLEO|nr:uncharacterized protein BDR25DRAFT_390357 [Lindgomyces ingoldianus]KAF2477975.1 hypothetical protein BDR25DRAFT_390357 [Lindgomyces ingoldianus]